MFNLRGHHIGFSKLSINRQHLLLMLDGNLFCFKSSSYLTFPLLRKTQNFNGINGQQLDSFTIVRFVLLIMPPKESGTLNLRCHKKESGTLHLRRREVSVVPVLYSGHGPPFLFRANSFRRPIPTAIFSSTYPLN